jgi:hypothetical protein
MSNLYMGLSKLRLLRKNYSLKFLFIAFIGIHIPLITIVILIVTNNFIFNQNYIIISVLAATLGASNSTLYFLNKLLWPLTGSEKRTWEITWQINRYRPYPSISRTKRAIIKRTAAYDRAP